MNIAKLKHTSRVTSSGANAFSGSLTEELPASGPDICREQECPVSFPALKDGQQRVLQTANIDRISHM